MKAFLNKLADKPKGQLILMAAGSLLLIGAIYYFYFYAAVSREQQELKEQIADLEKQIQEETSIANNLSRYKQEVEVLDKRLELVLLELPDKKEIAGFLESVSVLAQSNGLEVIKFSPRKAKLKDFFAAVPADLELQGTFHQLATFFDEVGHLPRIVNIDEIAISIVKEVGSKVFIRARCIATAFRYLDEEEQKLVAKRKKKKKKRRR